jgi:hypothetical protein
MKTLMPPKSMPLDDLSQESFAFWLTREFLAADDSRETENLSDRFIVLIGSFLFAVIALVGLITRGNV